MSELKPCPFCGADNGYVDVIPNPFSNDIYSRGHCIKCHAVGTFYVQSYLEGELRPSFEQMAQMATEQWNTRPIEDELRKRIAELEKALNIDTDLTIAGLRKELRDATARIAELEALVERLIEAGDAMSNAHSMWVAEEDKWDALVKDWKEG